MIAVPEAGVEVQPGEVVGLIGPNRAGKSTLIDAVSALARADAAAPSVLLLAEPAAGSDEREWGGFDDTSYEQFQAIEAWRS